MITGESSEKYKQHCESLGAKAYFEKPVNYAALKAALHAELESRPAERRAHVRLNMRVQIKLRGKDAAGKDFEAATMTENASPAGFLANCSLNLKQRRPARRLRRRLE